ncbi:MAG TPA: alpha/beta hydrolase-fold protein [Intrasporangium sp.]|uniref:alpha/beta hydrolase n=1 Tax=Intrasporangium sp. TaxID=1925024 RepID=UPI002D785CC0|nr:alpha/beta hydrolase-fold protein [Intrasporangium sp.]HET7397020.1 alpha/beta hydrolase-fold protein [Intrasporangium sp.]
MSLTGGGLLVGLGCLALVLLLLIALGLPRTSRRWVAVSIRGTEAVALSIVVVALGAAALNDEYSFYVSWSDLLGARSPSTSTHGGASAQRAASARAAGPGFSQWAEAAPGPLAPHPGIRLQAFSVTGARSGVHGQVLVDLPPGYAANRTHRYPVVLALHGFPGNPAVWVHTIHVDSIVDDLVARHRLGQSIIVMPQVNDPATVDTECVDAPAGTGPQAETWLAQDVPAWVMTHLRAQPLRTSWAVMGYSFGGWCAAMLGMHHPDVFGAAIVLQGYFRPDFSAGYDPIPPGSPAARAYDLIRAARTDPPPLAMWVLSTKTDGLSYPTTALFVQDVRPPLSVTTVLLKTGGHRLSVFIPLVPDALSWLGETMPGFRA